MKRQAATIPDFPASREIRLEDKPLFDHLLALKMPEISAYTFVNMFAWREPHKVGVSRLGDWVVVHYNDAKPRVCLAPLGEGCAKAAIEVIFSRMRGDVEMAYMPARSLEHFEGRKDLVIELDRDNCDYLYLAEDLINLSGRSLDAKRNHISRFKSRYKYEYVELDQATALECHEFAQEWCQEKSCETVEGLRRESCAVYQMLTNFDALDLRGGAIRVDDRIVAFALGSLLNPETLVVHVEKAAAGFDGLYQVINNEFCIHEAREVKYVNREQDLGMPGLRKAKESYQPVKLIETYRIKKVPVSKEG